MSTTTLRSEIWGDQFTKLQVESFASIVLAQLPFPPLPLLALKGEDARETHASTHDLLAQALVSEQVRGQQGLGDVSERKLEILKQLQAEVHGLWEVRVRSDTAPTVDACYEAFQRHFRAFMALFPGSPDLRFGKMADVDRGSTVWMQTHQHLQARLSNTVGVGEEALVLPVRADASASYANLIAAYAAELHSYGREND